MRAPREPGFYWVLVPSRRRIAIAEWSADFAPGQWVLSGLTDPLDESEVPAVLSERLEPRQ